MSAINSEYRKHDHSVELCLKFPTRTFRAGTFNFFIGPDEVHFILYQNLVSRYSEPFGRMMKNGMRESREGKAVLKDVDPNTFCRFAEFIHSSDYSAVDPVDIPLTLDEDALTESPVSPTPEDDAVPVEPAPEEPSSEVFLDDGWGFASSKKDKKKEKKKKKGKSQATMPPPLPFPVDLAPGLNQTPTMSYAQTFACHISVYHFAEFYLILGLKELAIQKLSEALNIFRCFPQRTGDICHIVRLAYNQEDGNTHPSPLHDVISDYATNNFTVLTASRRFNDLLAEGGLFPPDVCRKVARLLRNRVRIYFTSPKILADLF